MPRDRAYELMTEAIKGVLPSLEMFARTARNSAARKKLMAQIEQMKEALGAAEDVSRSRMSAS